MKIRDFIANRVAVGCLIAIIICCSLTISRCVYFLCCCCWRDRSSSSGIQRSVCNVGCGFPLRIFGLSSQVKFRYVARKHSPHFGGCSNNGFVMEHYLTKRE